LALLPISPNVSKKLIQFLSYSQILLVVFVLNTDFSSIMSTKTITQQRIMLRSTPFETYLAWMVKELQHPNIKTNPIIQSYINMQSRFARMGYDTPIYGNGNIIQEIINNANLFPYPANVTLDDKDSQGYVDGDQVIVLDSDKEITSNYIRVE